MRTNEVGALLAIAELEAYDVVFYFLLESTREVSCQRIHNVYRRNFNGPGLIGCG